MADGRQRNPRLTRYPPELRERAVRLVHETVAETGERHGAMRRVAAQLGVGYTSVRNWMREADIEAGTRPAIPNAADERIRALERENRELRRANEILKSASAFFAAELDRHSDS
jgi:transposase